LLADAAYLAIGALRKTLRLTETGREHLVRARASGRPILFILWHNRLLYVGYLLARERLVIMASRSRDGDLVARVAHDHGIAAVRGSTSRGGAAAARALARAMRERGLAGAITPDGPRGPRYVLQPGSLLIARLANALVVPVAVGFSRKKVFSSWDGFQVPAPFARTRLVFGEPVSLPDLRDAAALEACRADLERRLIEVTDAADHPFLRRPAAP
jgi:lysophospholipid acyltransferase (LPLAT)-like uncharacterized protein